MASTLGVNRVVIKVYPTFNFLNLIPPPTLGLFTIPNQTVTPSIVFPYSITFQNPTSNSSGSFSYTLNSTYAGISLSGRTITFSNLASLYTGSVRVNGTQASYFNYTAVSFSTTFTVVKNVATLSNFSITIPLVSIDSNPSLLNQVLPLQTLTLTNPTTTGDGAFSYTTSTPSLVSIQGNVLSFLGEGTAQVTAVQANGTTFFGKTISAAVNVVFFRAVIEPLTLFTRYATGTTFSLNPVSFLNTTTPYVLTNPSYIFTTTTPDLINPDGNTITTLQSGTAQITCTLLNGSNYYGTSVSSTFTVFVATDNYDFSFVIPDIVYNPSNLSYPFSDPTDSPNTGAFSYTTSSAGIVSLSDKTLNVLGTGNYELTVTQAAFGDYSANVNVYNFRILRGITEPITLTVNGVSYGPLVDGATLTLPDQDYGSNFQIVPVANANTDGDYVCTAVLNAAVDAFNTVTFDVAGRSVVRVVQSNGSLYNGTPNGILLVFEVLKILPTVTFFIPDETYVENGTITVPAATSSSTGEFSYFVGSDLIDGMNVYIESTGEFEVMAFQAADSNYLENTVTATFSIEKATPILSNFVDLTIPYNAVTPYSLLATSTNIQTDILYSSSDPTVAEVTNINKLILRKVGTCIITASQPATNGYFALSPTNVTLTVQKSTPTFSPNWTIPNKQTGASPFSIVGLLTSTNTVTTINYTSSNPNVATVSGHTITVGGAGSTTITASQTSTANYNSPTSVTTTFTVTDPTAPVSNICFLAGTPVETDQGVVPIETLDPERHTIRNKRIVGVTKTWSPHAWLVEFEPHALGENKPTARTVMSMYHKVDHDGVMTSASRLINGTTIKKVPYNRETLYNVLQDEHGTMIVNNVVCETLHPDNITAKLFRLLNALPRDEQVKRVSSYNALCEKNKIYAC